MRRVKFFMGLLFFFWIFPFSIGWGLPAEDIQLVVDEQYFEVAKRMIQEAKSSIRIMMFEMGYYEKHPSSPSNLLIRELIEARKRGVQVEVILEVGEGEGKEKTTERNRETGRILSEGGVRVIFDPLLRTTHAKWMLVDEELALIGSTNWTYHALTHNHEVSVLVRSKGLAKSLISYFEQVKAKGSKTLTKDR